MDKGMINGLLLTAMLIMGICLIVNDGVGESVCLWSLFRAFMGGALIGCYVFYDKTGGPL